MQKKLKLATLALFSCTLAMAQNEKNTEQNMAQGLDENAFTFSEAQLCEDDDMSSNVTIPTPHPTYMPRMHVTSCRL